MKRLIFFLIILSVILLFSPPNFHSKTSIISLSTVHGQLVSVKQYNIRNTKSMGVPEGAQFRIREASKSRVIYLTNLNKLIYPLVGNSTHYFFNNASRGILVGRFKELALIQVGNNVVAFNTTAKTTVWENSFQVDYISVGDADNDGKEELFLVHNDTIVILEEDGTIIYNDKIYFNSTSKTYPITSITASQGLILFVYKNTTKDPAYYYAAKAALSDLQNHKVYVLGNIFIEEISGRIVAVRQGFYLLKKTSYLFVYLYMPSGDIVNAVYFSKNLNLAFVETYWNLGDVDGDGYDDIIIDNGTMSMSVVKITAGSNGIYAFYNHTIDVEVFKSNVYAIIDHKLYWMNTSFKLQLNRTDYYFIDLDAYDTLYALTPEGLIVKNVQKVGSEEYIWIPEAPFHTETSTRLYCYWTKKIAWTPLGVFKFKVNISKCIVGEHAFGILLENGTLLVYNATKFLRKFNNMQDAELVEYHSGEKAIYIGFSNGTIKFFYGTSESKKDFNAQLDFILAESDVYVLYHNSTHVTLAEYDWSFKSMIRRHTIEMKNPRVSGAYADYDGDGRIEFGVSAWNSTHYKYAILSELLTPVLEENKNVTIWSFGDGFVIYNGSYGKIYPSGEILPMNLPSTASYHLVVSKAESYYFTNQSLGAKGDGGLGGFVVNEYATSANLRIIGFCFIENQTLTGIDRKYPSLEILDLPYDSVLKAYISKPSVSFNVNVSDDIEVDTVQVFLNNTKKFMQKVNAQQKVVQVSFTSDEGYYELKIIVNDTSGKETILTNYTYIDGTSPSVSLNAPTLINDTEVYVEYAASETLTYISKIEIYVNGTSRLEEAHTEKSVSGSQIIYLGDKEGIYNVTLVAYDAAGNAGKSSIFIKVDLTLPTLIVSGIENNTALVVDQVNAHVETSDENGISRVEVYRDNTLIKNTTSTEFNVTIPLLEGVNKIIFKSIDNAGNVKKLVYYIYKDTTPPQVKITNPANKSWLGASQVNVSWDASDNLGLSKVEIYTNGTLNTTLSPDETWHILTLPDGIWNITVVVYDEAGNKNSSTIWIYIDTTPPAVKITSPSNNTYINKTSVIVTWEMSDNIKLDRIEVYLDGEKKADLLPPTNQYQFTDLSEGKHIIKIVIYDKLNHKASSIIMMTVDLTKPSVKITSPTLNSYVSKTFTLEWNASDNYGISEFVIYANDKEIVNVPANQTSANITLPDGKYVITVVAIDYAGNKDIDQITITVDSTSPSIKIISPSSLSTIHTADFVVIWNASDNIELDRIQVWLNDTLKAELPPNTSQYAFIGIPDGSYLIKVVAIDKAGNSAYDSVIIIIDAPLSVRITKPENGTWLNTQIISISLSITNTTKLKNITIYIDGVPRVTNTTNTSFKLFLSEGIHNITVVIEDIAENVGKDTIIIYIDTTAPGVRINIENNTEVKPGNITISWTATDNMGVKIFRIYLNESLVKETKETSTILNLSEGKWIIKVEAEDYAGNKASSTVIIIVKKPKTEAKAMGEEIENLLLLIPVTVGVIVGILLLRRAKRIHMARKGY